MKIVDRATFLAMPPNTLFSNYKPVSFGDLLIKGDTIAGIDFYAQQIADAIKCGGSHEFFDILTRAQETGCSFEMDFNCEGRDGMFDKEQLFAVWEKADIVALIVRLTEALFANKEDKP